MALTTDRERRICRKYSAPDGEGMVHCRECPLVKSAQYTMCKANSHFNRNTREWEMDDMEDERP